MLSTVIAHPVRHASVDRFALLRSKVLAGHHLKEVEAIQDSIVRYGLLTPITTIEKAGRLIVVDGRKRLAAIRRLAFEGRLPRSLQRIPYRFAGDGQPASASAAPLIASRSLYLSVMKNLGAGMDLNETARTFSLSRQCVRHICTLSRLTAHIREAFFGRRIDFAQARAYASIPDKAEQIQRFFALGPLATPDQILSTETGVESTIANRRCAA